MMWLGISYSRNLFHQLFISGIYPTSFKKKIHWFHSHRIFLTTNLKLKQATRNLMELLLKLYQNPISVFSRCLSPRSHLVLQVQQKLYARRIKS